MKIIPILIMSGMLLLSGCVTAKPASPAEEIKVQYTAATQPWLADLYRCAGKNVVLAELQSTEALDPSNADIAMRIGETTPMLPTSYQIGAEEIIVLSNSQNPLRKLTLEQVQGVFTGQIRNWNEIGGNEAPVQVWVFAAGEDVQQIFQDAALGGTPVTSLAWLATGPDEMVQAVAADVNAIGFVGDHWKADGVRALFEVASVPLLVSTASIPAGAVMQVIDCLQK
jgi:phosphate transport system substrate-binding protein